MIDDALQALGFDLADPQQLEQLLLLQCECSGVSAEAIEQHFSAALLVYAELLAEGIAWLPFFWVLDLTVLLRDGTRPLLFAEQASELDRTRLRSRYQMRCLTGLFRMQELEAARDALASLELPWGAFAFALGRLCSSWSNQDLATCALSPSFVRELAFRRRGVVARKQSKASEGHASSRPSEGIAAVASSVPESDRLRVEQDSLALELHWEWMASLVEGPELEPLQAEDVFVIKQFALLGSAPERLLARERRALEERFGSLPVLTRSREREQVWVDLDAVGHFPQGGLDGLSTRGSLENLLRSELVYIEEEEHPDLFSLRYLESELLYYLRDEGQLIRRHRNFRFFIELHESYDWVLPQQPQRLSSMLCAFLQRLVADLLELLTGEALRIELCIVSAGPEQQSVRAGQDVRRNEASQKASRHVRATTAGTQRAGQEDSSTLGPGGEPLAKWFALRFADELRRSVLEISSVEPGQLTVSGRFDALYLGWRYPAQVLLDATEPSSKQGAFARTDWIVIRPLGSAGASLQADAMGNESRTLGSPSKVSEGHASSRHAEGIAGAERSVPERERLQYAHPGEQGVLRTGLLELDAEEAAQFDVMDELRRALLSAWMSR
ncbi:MAG: hypothetical protein RBU37_13405 [Myxococcota bacterium]|jgi:hypothetical protein|nr:hypothetical protein [Myxococcota bacterium]